MEMNFRTEQKRFQKEWQHFREEYRNAGMSEESIDELYEFDLHCFNRNRAAYRWNQSLSGNNNDFTNDESPLFLKFIDKLSYTDSYHLESDRFAWIDEIEDEHLYLVSCPFYPSRPCQIIQLTSNPAAREKSII